MKKNEIPLKNYENEKEIQQKKFEFLNDGDGDIQTSGKRRYLVAILISFGLFTSYTLRVNLSVAIVAMTTKSDQEDAEFNWDSKTQGIVLSSFFYGYFSTQLLGGWLSSKLGGKKVFGIGTGIAALLTICTPPLTRIHVYLLIILRILQGIIEGAAHPCIHSILANWAPPLERSKLLTLSYSGGFIGIVYGMTISGLIAKYFEWTLIFYFLGVSGLIWFILWWMIITDRPEDDPKISQSELQYIQRSLGTSTDDESKKRFIPWKSILTSMPTWSIFVAHFTENWSFSTMLTQLPTFMKDILNYKVGKTGFFSALPYLAISMTSPLSGVLADYIRSKKYLTTTQVRKIFNSSAFIAQSFFMLLTIFVSSNTAVITCLVASVALGGFAGSGFAANHLDIAPEYAGVIMGLSNTISTIPGIISPIITGYIVENKSEAEWRNIFLIAGSIQLIGALFYGIFSSGKKQEWAKSSKNNKITTINNRIFYRESHL